MRGIFKSRDRPWPCGELDEQIRSNGRRRLCRVRPSTDGVSTSDEREADRTLHGTHLWSIRLGPALVGLVGIILRMSSFCRSVIVASTASTSVVSSSSKPGTLSLTVRWGVDVAECERTSYGT